MELSVNNGCNKPSFGNFYLGKSMPAKKASQLCDNFRGIVSDITLKSDGKLLVKNKRGKVIQILEDKPTYREQSHKKVILYPVMIDGVPTFYPIRYNVSQNTMKGVGTEILRADKDDYKYISAREIAKHMDRVEEVESKKANNINVFYRV